mmetsp:Transcript_302/g.599  ORF Transcript_302/g.599 Transcript_302/m.599 type:complete len:343 (-) Transcript_302:239-1267(-)
MIDQILQRTQGLLKRLPGKTECDTGSFRGNVGQARVPREKGALSEEIPRTQYLIDVLTIPKSDIVHLHPSLLQNVKHLPHISLVNDPIPLLKTDGRQRIGNLDQHGLVKVSQKLHLAKHIQHILLLTSIVIREHVSEGPLVDLPKLTIRVGNAGSGTGTIVKQGQFPKGCPPCASPHVIPIDSEADVSVLDDVEVIPHLPLLNDDGARGDGIGLHGVDEKAAFLLGQGGEDKVVREGIVDELNGGVAFGEVRDDEVLGHIEGLSEDILGAFGLSLAVNVDSSFAVGDVGGLHLALVLFLSMSILLHCFFNRRLLRLLRSPTSALWTWLARSGSGVLTIARTH